MNSELIWLSLFALGAAHGVNPAMGWLFAVGIGLQERDRRAVWRALGPLALGHALAIAVVVLIAAAIGLVLPMHSLKWLVAAALIGCGALQLTRHRHPRYGGMRMSARELTIWSFLMASAHGAGLMVLPLLLETSAAAAPLHAETSSHSAHMLSAGVNDPHTLGIGAALLHTIGYLAVTAVLAVVVYEKVGLRVLRRGWINVNLLWTCALFVTGVLTLLL